MNLHNINLDTTVGLIEQIPEEGAPEVAFAGRSNSGKSSLINYLASRNKLARTASAPGKTRVINFYNVDKSMFLVDLPGYGYARVSKKLKEDWGTLINTYIQNRSSLKLVILVCDIRHKPSDEDVMMYNYLIENKIPCVVAASKADKVNTSSSNKSVGVIMNTLASSGSSLEVIPISPNNNKGRDVLWGIIKKHCFTI